MRWPRSTYMEKINLYKIDGWKPKWTRALVKLGGLKKS
jgi:hypothetical protein